MISITRKLKTLLKRWVNQLNRICVKLCHLRYQTFSVTITNKSTPKSICCRPVNGVTLHWPWHLRLMKFILFSAGCQNYRSTHSTPTKLPQTLRCPLGLDSCKNMSRKTIDQLKRKKLLLILLWIIRWKCVTYIHLLICPPCTVWLHITLLLYISVLGT